MALTFGFVPASVHRNALEQQSRRQQEKMRMSADINSSVTMSSSNAERKRHAKVNPSAPGYNVSNVVGAAVVSGVRAIAKDKPLKGPDVGSDGFIIVSNPFFDDDD
eukprot:scpid53292/ scgid30819/ 